MSDPKKRKPRHKLNLTPLQLDRETLQDLTASEAEAAEGGISARTCFCTMTCVAQCDPAGRQPPH